MRSLLPILSFVFLVAGSALSQSLAYYIDAAGGNDAGDGRTPATAWQTLTKVNARIFYAGDTIYFKSGSSWTGQLKPKGSGRAAQPIVIDQYGGAARPVIHGAGVIGQGTLYLFNQEFWEINGLEITNDAATAGDRRGVLIAASNAGTMRHIYLKNLYIHNVKGIVDQISDAAKRTGGIGIETTADNTVGTRFDDLLIEGCTIAYCENTGLYTDNLVDRSDYPQSAAWLARRFTNVRIRKNLIHHISKNAMILRLFDRGVVEHNVCTETALQVTGNTMYTISSDGTVFQYNEGSFNRATENDPTGGDGSMYDADLRSCNIVFQYSYSHDNSHGLFWNCTVQSDSGIICRYNISQNDRGIIFCVNYPVTSAYIYNNTVYIGPGLSPKIISERNVNSGTRSYFFLNNVVVNLSPTAVYDFRSSGYTRVIDHNLFFGSHPSGEPADPHKLTSDPRLVNPGSGGTGINTLDGYRLQSGSPCIDAGLLLQGHSALDFWGNPVPSGAGADRGAHELPPPSGVGGEPSGTPRQFGLRQNYPNPFNPATNIPYSLSGARHVEIAVFDLFGRKLRTLVDGPGDPGDYSVAWDGSTDAGDRVASGVYVTRLLSGSTVSTIKLVLLR